MGGEGDDRLSGGTGRDRMTGGEGADRFVFTAGRDTITDFEPDDDAIDLSRLAGVNGFDDGRDAASRRGGDLLLGFEEGVLRLEGTRLAQLDADDFIF